MAPPSPWRMSPVLALLSMKVEPDTLLGASLGAPAAAVVTVVDGAAVDAGRVVDERRARDGEGAVAAIFVTVVYGAPVAFGHGVPWHCWR